jgi:hypothetical protein
LTLLDAGESIRALADFYREDQEGFLADLQAFRHANMA